MEDVPCNLCASRDEELRFEINGYRIVRCGKCGLVYVNPRPQIEESMLYGEDHPCYCLPPDRAARKFRRYMRQIERFAQGGELLDVGCGTGEFLLVARDAGWRVVGVDVSEFATEYARREHGVSVFTGSIREVDLPPQSFDVVTLWATIEHLPDPKGDLLAIASLLRHGGLIAIETGNIGGLRPVLEQKKWWLLSPPKHLYYFTRRTLCELLNRCGFDVVRVRTRGRVGVVRIPVFQEIGQLIGWGDLMYVYAVRR